MRWKNVSMIRTYYWLLHECFGQKEKYQKHGNGSNDVPNLIQTMEMDGLSGTLLLLYVIVYNS